MQKLVFCMLWKKLEVGKLSKRILIVEDQEENRLILEEILKDTYIIDTAENGRQALEIMQNGESPILVLSDVKMPVMDGFELISIMKADPRLHNVPVIFITASAEEEKSLSAGAIDFITKPVNPETVRLRVANHIELSNYRESLEEMVQERTRELISTKETFLETMATMIEYRSLESGEHIRRTKELTAVLVEQLLAHPRYGCELLMGDPVAVSRAAPLHDVGKIGIPDNILLKPGRLTPEEFMVIETHAAIGSEMIATMIKGKPDEYLKNCYDIARHHHERFDGKGYPDRLAGENIPLSARIVALVDVYDALVSERCYKKGMSHEEAMVIIKKESGTHFDPEIVKAMFDVEGQVQALYG